MKNPKKLTIAEKKFLSKKGLDPSEFLIIKRESDAFVFINIKTLKLLKLLK